ncbi:uncharacterized protein LOC119726001 [Patiria miniata]|uniref:Uncharacterized protein n=1 Tax=Patiria miniata TaxID=46514 RepID=A0A913ZP40_PATMI|nr:uncharacterized protein LOC119726001 [Patiria miniata]XP_038053558.1 uncharacterized protein LOC119726001 [Patiria miniata]
MECLHARCFPTTAIVMIIMVFLLVCVAWFSPIYRDDFRPVPIYGRKDSVVRTHSDSEKASSGSLVITPVDSTAASHSSQDGVANQPLDYEIVISQYNENLNWMKPTADHSHVYHKGKDKGPPFDVYKWEKLPNVGREAHTYLHHIVHNYDKLANITVFLQGTGPGREHSQSCFPTAIEFVQQAKKHKYCKITQRYKNGNWGRIRHFGKWLKSLQNGQMRRANLTLGEFYTALFGTKPPDLVPVCFTGCISASRENLRRFPVSFYEKAISFVNDHSNPEEAHYFERLWATIINVKI